MTSNGQGGRCGLYDGRRNKEANNMRNPDMTYTDILARDIELYVNLDDEECHKLEAVTGTDGDQRYDIKIWVKHKTKAVGCE